MRNDHYIAQALADLRTVRRSLLLASVGPTTRESLAADRFLGQVDGLMHLIGLEVHGNESDLMEI